MASMRFEGQVVLVTGASLGVGRACADALLAEGATVVLNARRRGPLEEAAEAMRAGERVHIAPADVSDASAMDAVLSDVIERYGRLDGLVNNAGAHFRGPVTERTAAELGIMVDVNLRAPLVLSRVVLPHLLETRGFIVNIASLAGKVPLDGSAAYSATKFGLRAFTFALHEELRESGVRVSCVSPGPIETSFILDDLSTVTDITLSQRMCTPADVAALVLDCAVDGLPERAWPPEGARLATIGYLFPALRRMLKPLMRRRGARNRQKLLARLG